MSRMGALPVPRAVIESKEKGRTPTCWLVLHYAEDDAAYLKRAIEVLGRVGWKPDPSQPPTPLDGVREVVFASEGSALFNGWTAAESRRKLADLKVALSELRVTTYRRRLTLADML